MKKEAEADVKKKIFYCWQRLIQRILSEQDLAFDLQNQGNLTKSVKVSNGLLGDHTKIFRLYFLKTARLKTAKGDALVSIARIARARLLLKKIA